MPVRQLDELAPHLSGVDRAGGVVRVDDDERPGRGRDQAADVIDVGQPAAGRISAIEDWPGADLREHSCVQWIGRHRDEHFIPSLGKRSERQLNAFRRPGCDDDAVRKDRHSTPRTIGGYGFARFEDPDRGRVAILSAPQRRFDGVNEVRRRLEPEDDRIADVEIPDFPSGCLNLSGLRHDIADCVDEPPNPCRYRDRGGRSG